MLGFPFQWRLRQMCWFLNISVLIIVFIYCTYLEIPSVGTKSHKITCIMSKCSTPQSQGRSKPDLTLYFQELHQPTLVQKWFSKAFQGSLIPPTAVVESAIRNLFMPSFASPRSLLGVYGRKLFRWQAACNGRCRDFSQLPPGGTDLGWHDTVY